MYDRIRLDPTLYEPVSERRPEKSPEEPTGRCFTIEADLEEEGIIVIGYPDYEARIEAVPMVVKISDGMSQGEFLFYWRQIGEEARSNWEGFLVMLERTSGLVDPVEAGCDPGDAD